MKLDRDLTPDELFDRLPEPERMTALVLRQLVREELPLAREKLSWGAPFYFGRHAVCFIWPASIPWGKVDRGVALGFPTADRLDHGGALSFEGRKRVGRIIYGDPDQIDVGQVSALLRAAWNYDDR